MKTLKHVHRNSPGKCHVAFCYKFADRTFVCSSKSPPYASVSEKKTSELSRLVRPMKK